MSSSKEPGRNWTRETRRSAAARLGSVSQANANTEVRERHAVTKQVKRRNVDLAEIDTEDRGGSSRSRNARRRRTISSFSTAGDGGGDGTTATTARRSRRRTSPRPSTGSDDEIVEEEDEIYSPLQRP